LYFKQNPSSNMYFNQGLLGPDPEPNPEPIPEPNPDRNPLRNRKSLRIWILLFAQKNMHFCNAAFSSFILLPFLQDKIRNRFRNRIRTGTRSETGNRCESGSFSSHKKICIFVTPPSPLSFYSLFCRT
jgi:hypothetical protein